eukprot:3432309-Amphidinium_carterae.1
MRNIQQGDVRKDVHGGIAHREGEAQIAVTPGRILVQSMGLCACTPTSYYTLSCCRSVEGMARRLWASWMWGVAEQSALQTRARVGNLAQLLV